MSSVNATPRALKSAPSPEASDVELVALALHGDSAAKEQIFRRYAPGIMRMVDRLLRDPTEAEDVVQHTFEVAFARLDQLSVTGSLRNWLLQIAVRRCHRVFRRQRLLRALGFQSLHEGGSLLELAAAGLSGEQRAELALFDVALSRLPHEQRVIWMLRHVEDLSLEECASACGCSLATVKRRLRAADEGVRAHVGEAHGR